MTKFRHYAGAVVISTTAIGYSAPLAFITSDGDLKVAGARTAAYVRSGVLPMRIKDSGLAPPVPSDDCPSCTRQARVFYAGAFTWNGVGGVHASRIAYVKRTPGSAAGGAVFRLEVRRAGWNKFPERISAVTDACGIVPTDTTDLKEVDNSAVVLERAGPDLSCDARADNLATVIRLNTAETDAGTTLPLLLETGNPLQAQASPAGRLTGFLSFETDASGSILVHRDLQFATPTVLLEMEQATGANLVRTDAGRLFVTATPNGLGLTLFRVEPDGSLSPPLYSFTGFNPGNPLEGGLRDSTHLYLSDENRILRVALKATIENAEVVATLDPALHIGRRLLDVSTRPGRIVFEAEDDSFSTLGGVFSAATNGNNAAVTVLTHIPDPEGGTAKVELAAFGRAFINIANHYGTHDALVVRTDGTQPTKVVNAYWAGSTRRGSASLARSSVIPPAYLFYATRLLENGDPADVGTDTLISVNPRTLAPIRVLGTLTGTMRYQAITVSGLGRHAAARVKMDRFGAIDSDVLSLDALTRDSLTVVADTPADDLPVGG